MSLGTRGGMAGVGDVPAARAEAEDRGAAIASHVHALAATCTS